jgi:hypothetical protein
MPYPHYKAAVEQPQSGSGSTVDFQSAMLGQCFS